MGLQDKKAQKSLFLTLRGNVFHKGYCAFLYFRWGFNGTIENLFS